MPGEPPSAGERVRTAEVIAALSLATDLSLGLPFEHGLQSTLAAVRLADRLGVDQATASSTYYGCMLFYVGCTADAELAAELFDDDAFLRHINPVIFGTPAQELRGVLRALGGEERTPARRALRAAGRLPTAARGQRRHLTAMCEVAQMLAGRLGLPEPVPSLFAHLTERWDGKGHPGALRGEALPLALRIIHVARDATFQRLLGDDEEVARVIRQRAGHAFDPDIANLLAADVGPILAAPEHGSAWEAALDREPGPPITLQGADIDRALAAIGDFADLQSPYLAGHSSGVAELAAAAARRCGFPAADATGVRRSALVHDVGRVAVPARIWQKPGPLTADEWEQVRLHAYHSERVLCRSPWLAALTPVASSHHERLDGGGYHRQSTATALSRPARLLAAADAYHAMTEPRPHRPALSPQQAADALGEDAQAGRLDPGSVGAVLAAAGQRVPRIDRPAGLTEREAQVVTLLARGLQTKQVARALGISAKTADRHVQNAYAKIGVSTRAAAALFAMQHGLATWGEFPIVDTDQRS